MVCSDHLPADEGHLEHERGVGLNYVEGAGRHEKAIVVRAGRVLVDRRRDVGKSTEESVAIQVVAIVLVSARPDPECVNADLARRDDAVRIGGVPQEHHPEVAGNVVFGGLAAVLVVDVAESES